jgi:hypothetical protein
MFVVAFPAASPPYVKHLSPNLIPWKGIHHNIGLIGIWLSGAMDSKNTVNSLLAVYATVLSTVSWNVYHYNRVAFAMGSSFGSGNQRVYTLVLQTISYFYKIPR